MKTDEKRRKSEEGSLESFPLQRRQNIGPLSSALQKALRYHMHTFLDTSGVR